jgi:hypothetical protein
MKLMMTSSLWLECILAVIIGGTVLFVIQYFFFNGVKPYPAFVKKAKKGYPVINNGLEFGPDTCVATLQNYPVLYGKLVEFYLGAIRCLMLNDVELSKEILLKRPKRFQRAQLMQYAAEKLSRKRFISC